MYLSGRSLSVLFLLICFVLSQPLLAADENSLSNGKLKADISERPEPSVIQQISMLTTPLLLFFGTFLQIDFWTAKGDKISPNMRALGHGMAPITAGLISFAYWSALQGLDDLLTKKSPTS